MAIEDKNPKQVTPLKPRVGIGEAVIAELKDISQRRGKTEEPTLNPANWINHCHEANLFGISISGGGIRSATFGLGVLQGLAEKNLLSKADYISTVSGGGYIGAWLQGLASREPGPYEPVLDPKRTPDLSSKDPITFLRKYSNYLAPRNGLSLDALVIPLIWFRNMLLNQTIIISALMALFIVLLVPATLLRQIALYGVPHWAVLLMIVLMVAAAVITVANIGASLQKIVNREFDPTAGFSAKKEIMEQHIGSLVVMPLFIATLLLVFTLAAKQSLFHSRSGLPVGFLILFALIASLQLRGGFRHCYIEQRKSVDGGKTVQPWAPWLHVLWMSLVTASFLFGLFVEIWHVSADWHPATAFGSFLIIAWVPCLYLIALIVGIGLHVGLMGRDFPDASREWLARVAALIVTFLGIWAALFALAIFAPWGIAKLWLWGKARWVVTSGIWAWILSTIMSVLAGKSGKSGAMKNGTQEQQSSAIDLVARYGPCIAIPGFLVAVAFATQMLLHRVPWNISGGFVENFTAQYWEAMPFNICSWQFPLLSLALLGLIFVVLSWRVNINEFSMHHFYKNRLVRCYLGASATKNRMADPFTGFDSKDDIPLSKLRFQQGKSQRVPYPIVNAALTVTAGTELATQERKALPWFFTPHYSGFYPARSDEDRVEKDPQSKACYADSALLGNGIALGTATGISGAAVNPNSGFHSSPQTAFLLTLFNVRLGWWLGNPTKENIFQKPGPTFALWWLVRELLGFVDESSNFLNLSDGGHFENLGLYELVRRRCHYIVAIDGEEDTDYQFEGLGGAIRKCREDFGVEIEIDPKPIIPHGKLSGTHCVVGRINYRDENQSSEQKTGVLLYLKASITGNEPADVEQYRRQNQEFPQQSTADQFFSESQFESYRRLGLHVARTALDHIEPDVAGNMEKLFERLQSQWLLPPRIPEGTFSRHGQAYVDMLKTLSGASDLKIDGAVIGNMPTWAQASDDGRRKFFFYLQLLQLIEDVFVDLDFANAYKWNHLSTAGWKSVITYWAQQKDVEDVWQSQKNNYGQPFRDCFNDLVLKREGVHPDQRQ